MPFTDIVLALFLSAADQNTAANLVSKENLPEVNVMVIDALSFLERLCDLTLYRFILNGFHL